MCIGPNTIVKLGTSIGLEELEAMLYVSENTTIPGSAFGGWAIRKAVIMEMKFVNGPSAWSHLTPTAWDALCNGFFGFVKLLRGLILPSQTQVSSVLNSKVVFGFAMKARLAGNDSSIPYSRTMMQIPLSPQLQDLNERAAGMLSSPFRVQYYLHVLLWDSCTPVFFRHSFNHQRLIWLQSAPFVLMLPPSIPSTSGRSGANREEFFTIFFANERTELHTTLFLGHWIYVLCEYFRKWL